MQTNFVKTDTVLDKILAHKVDEVAARQTEMPLCDVVSRAADTDTGPRVGHLRRVQGRVADAAPGSGFLQLLAKEAHHEQCTRVCHQMSQIIEAAR